MTQNMNRPVRLEKPAEKMDDGLRLAPLLWMGSAAYVLFIY